MEPEVIADYACVTGEGPLWHTIERRVYWLDIPEGRIFRYDPATGTHEQRYDTGGEAIGGTTMQADGALLLLMERGAIKRWREGEVTTMVEEIPEERNTRFNDVIADPRGRVFGGTMATKERPGKQYRIDTDGSYQVVIDEVHVPNGMGFTPDHRQLYFTDTPKLTIFRFDYDEATGEIGNRQVFVKTPEGEGVPDGMTVDAEGYVWSARWDGSCLVRYAPDGTEDRRIHFPVKKVSSVIFGGDDYTDMYVTTAGGHIKQTDGEHAGALFRLNLGIKGVPEFPSRIKL
ncbi:MAG: SMP-30/gluconolactonase/LRE family protein [Chloroflexi bacterium]|nr:SMP-30/gluconolactonase/LRE family protein [Chloroflexota bacterium]